MPQFETAKAPPAAKKFGLWCFGIAAVLLVIGVFAKYAVGCGNSTATTNVSAPSNPPDRQAGSAQTTTGNELTIVVKLDCQEWSDWIKLPSNVRFQVDAPGWLEYCFWDGRKVMVSNKETKWLGSIPNNTFRIRGAPGEAKITYEFK